MRGRFFVPVALLFIISGCAHYISAPSRALIDHAVSFRQLQENPDAYRGKIVMLGGNVARFERGPEGTRLEVVERRLDSRDLPDESLPSDGRFLATTRESLDPVSYAPGALVVMVGKVVGQKKEGGPGAAASYPVIAVTEIHDIVIEQETHWGSYGGI